MNKFEAEIKSNQLMKQHGLIERGWSFEFDNAKSRYGSCKHISKRITLSQYMLPHMKDEDIVDTILHEIAHALVGRGHGHNNVWRYKALEIGCRGKRCSDKIIDYSKLQYKYTGTCNNGHTTNRHKFTKNAENCSCAQCSNKYNPEFKFKWVQNF